MQESAIRRVAAPANALIVVAIIGMFLSPLGLIVALAHSTGGAGNMSSDERDIVSIAVIMNVVASIVMIIGAVRMKKLRSAIWAKLAATVAIVPVISPFFVLGIPFGIWAYVTLYDREVREAFERKARDE